MRILERLRMLDKGFEVEQVPAKGRYPIYRVRLHGRIVAPPMGIRELTAWTGAYTTGWLDSRIALRDLHARLREEEHAHGK